MARDRQMLVLTIIAVMVMWAVWLRGIDAFPPFIDETVHIHMGELNAQNGSILEGINLGRQFTIWWYMLFQPAKAAPIWVARTATLLAFLPGAAALIALARRVAGRWAALFAALLLLFSAYHLFFARLAMADTVAAGAILVVIHAAYRLRYSVSLKNAALVGLLLFLAAGAKINSLPFFGIPLAAALTLRPTGRKWSEQLRWLIVALGTGAGLLGIFMLVLRLRGLDFLGNSLSLAVSGRGALDLSSVFNPARIFGNAGMAFEAMSVYFHPLVLIALILAPFALLLSRRFRASAVYVLLCLWGPVLALWLNQPQETRFYVVPVALLLLGGGIGLAFVAAQQHLVVRFAALGIILLWGFVQWLPFAQAVTTPVTLPLPSRDLVQYVRSDASGFGFEQIAAELRSRDVTRLIGVLANCQGLRYDLWADYEVECPQMRPNGQDIAALTSLLNESWQDGVYVVLEDSAYAPATAPGEVVAAVNYPTSRPTLTIYDLAP